MRLLISGGPGSGCTSTAEEVGKRLGIPVFDSDSYFHKVSDPPFQEQYSPGERKIMLERALSEESRWIVCWSVATWGLSQFDPTHGVLLDIPSDVRLGRLMERQRTQFGDRIDSGGDMKSQNDSFMDWAAGYEERSGSGRNLSTDREFLVTQCDTLMHIGDAAEIEEVVEQIETFLKNKTNTDQAGGGNVLPRVTHP
jgi:adenylate kinase family enzyme